MDAFTIFIAIVSMPGIAIVGVVPAALGAGMAVLQIIGLIEHARGNLPDFDAPPKRS
jgi:hypothetical protein